MKWCVKIEKFFEGVNWLLSVDGKRSGLVSFFLCFGEFFKFLFLELLDSLLHNYSGGLYGDLGMPLSIKPPTMR